MKLGVYSDVHGDVEALRVAHRLAEGLGCSVHVCCGDLVDKAQPADEITAFVMEKRLSCVRGNHERWLLAAVRDGRYRYPLPRTTKVFLETTPASLIQDLDGIRVAVHHARPGSDMDGLFEDDLSVADVRGLLAEAECDVLLVGHTHQAFAVSHPGGGLVGNPGALGGPPFVQVGSVALISSTGESRVLARPESAAGTFGVLELPECRFQVCDLTGRTLPTNTLGAT